MSFYNPKFKIFFLSLAFFFVLFFFGAVEKSFAATYYWVGASGDNVNDPTNWNTSAVACTASGNAAALLTTDIFNFSSTCNTSASSTADWTVNTLNMNAGYTGTVDATGYKITAATLTQASSTLNVTTLEHVRNGTTFTFNGGTRTIATYLSSQGTLQSGTITLASGQTVSFTDLNVSGTGLLYLPTIANVTLNTVNLTYLTGSAATIYAGTINVTGNITTATNTPTGNTATFNLTGTSDQTLTINNSAYLGSTFNVYKSSGTVSLLGSGTFYVNTFNQSGGTFNAGSVQTLFGSVTTIYGTSIFTASSATSTFNNFVYATSTGVTFNHNNGTLVLAGAGSLNIDVNTTLTLNNFSIIKPSTGNTSGVATGDTIIVNGDFYLNGVLGISPSGAGTINVKGNVTINSTGNSSYGTLQVISDGTANPKIITFLGTYSGAQSFVLNNPYVSIVHTSATIFNSLTLTSGTFTTDNKNISFISTVTQNGGTFNAGSGSITVSGAFVLSSGIFNASSATTTFSSNFTATSTGSFVHNEGLVYLRGNATIDVNSSLTLNKLSIWAPPANTRTIASGDTLVVNSDLVFEQGVVNTGSITAKGNFSSGTTTSVITGSATVTFVDDGSNSPRTLTFNGGNLPNIVLNNPYASVIYNGRTDFSSLNIQNISGTFNLGSYGATVAATYTQSGATFNGGSGTVTHTGAVTVSAGTYIASSGATTFVSSLTATSTAAFSHNSGSVIFSGGTATIDAVGVGGTLSFNNLQINKTSYPAYFQIAAGDILIVSGTTTLTDGYLMSVLSSNLGTLKATGAISVASTFDGGRLGSDYPAYFLINGSGNQSFSIPVGTEMPQTILTSTSTTITMSGSGTVTWDAYGYGSSLTLNAGTINFGSVDHYLESTFTQTGGTFNGGSGLNTFNARNGTSGVSVSGGSFTASSRTTNVYGNFSISVTGTFNHNNGNFIFLGGTTNIGAEGVGGTLTFNNLEINKPTFPAYLIIDPGDFIVVNGTTTLTNGFLFSSYPSTNFGTLNAKGAVSVASTFDGGDNGSTYSGKLLIDGNTNQSFSIPAGASMPSTVLNNDLTTITQTGSGTVTWNADTNLSGFYLQSGTIDLNGVNTTFSWGLNQTGGILKLKGSETITFTSQSASLAASSTVEYYATSSNNAIKSWTYNGILKLNGSSGTFTLPSGTTTIANLNITAGTLNQGASHILNNATGTITVGSAGSWISTSTGDVSIGSGGVSNDGLISLVSNGNITDGANDIAIRSTTNGSSQRPWTGSGVFDLINVDVRDQGVAGGAPITVYYGGCNGGVCPGTGNNGSNWTFSGTASPNRNWRGTASGVWSNNANWLEGAAPDGTQTAIFGSTYTNAPTYDASAIAPANIQISGFGGTITLATSTSISGTYAQSSGTFNTAGYNLGVTGTTTISGGTFTGSSGAHSFGNLTFSSGTFNASTATTTVSGNFTKSGGTFNPNGGTFSLTGTSNTVTGNTTFANLSKTVTTSSTLNFAAGNTTIVTGTTTLRGASGQLLYLRSTASPTQWLFDPRGGLDLAYLDVKDSNNVNASSTNVNPNISAANYTGLTDASGIGSNTGWTFVVPAITVSATSTQNATTTLPVTAKIMGGAFVLTRNIGSGNVTNIVLTQAGSLPTSHIGSVSLYYKNSVGGICSDITSTAGTTLFGTASTWLNNRATTTSVGGMPVGTTPVCVYPVFTLTGSISPTIIYLNVDLRIANPSVDVVSSGTTVSPTTEIDIVGVTVVDGSGTGLPTLSLSVASSSISTANSTTLTWSTINATSCSVSNDWPAGSIGTSGSASTGVLSLHKTYRFTLTCGNDIGPASASVYVIATNPNAPILSLTVDDSTIEEGESTNINWSLGGGVINTPDACIATGGWLVTGAKDVDGGTESTGALTSSKSYTMACGNTYGTTTRSVSVSIPGIPAQNSCSNGDLDTGEVTIDSGGVCDVSAGSGGSLVDRYGDMMSLAMPDGTSVIFYLVNNGISTSLYMNEVNGSTVTVRKLTADGLDITNAFSGASVNRDVFTQFDCEGDGNACKGVKINLELQKTAVDGSLQNFTVEKTFQTTSRARKNINSN